jgi:hypothetical protein
VTAIDLRFVWTYGYQRAFSAEKGAILHSAP